MEMEENIEDRIIYWIINKKIKGFDFFTFSELIGDLNLNYNNDYYIKKIDKGFQIYYSKFDNLVKSIFEENN
jgi:hypothetical protein